jgi:hypothetical protein
MSTINTVPTPGTPIAANVFAFEATGGFDMEAGFATVTTLDQTTIPTFDVTDALQIEIPVSFFNTKLGNYDPDTQAFPVDSITISAADFQEVLTTKDQIVHVGAYISMYTNFQTYVTTYFGLPNGFASLFAKANASLTLSTDDKLNLFNLFTTPVNSTSPLDEVGNASEVGDDISGNYIKDLSGNITISDIVKLLRYAVDFNAFGNRVPLGPDEANGPSNWGVNHGFQPGDLIYVPNGTKVTLDLDISSELQTTPFNNPNLTVGSLFGPIGEGSSSVNSLTTDLSTTFTGYTTTSEVGDYAITSTVTRTNINRVLNVPLLFRMVA